MTIKTLTFIVLGALLGAAAGAEKKFDSADQSMHGVVPIKAVSYTHLTLPTN